jgi:hypothetical protein
MTAWIKNNWVLVASFAALLIAVFCALVYASPLRFPNAIKSAARNRDTIRLEELVDFPAVRDGLKATLKPQLTGAVTQQMAAGGLSGAPAPLVGAADQVAQGVVGLAVDQLVDQNVTAEGLEQAAGDQPVAAVPAGQRGTPLDELFPRNAEGRRFIVERKYLAFSRYRYTLTSTQGKSSVDIDLQRRGLFGWQVVRVTPSIDLTALPGAAPAVPTAASSGTQSLVQSATPPALVEALAPNGALPTVVGQCADTTVKEVSTRLEGVDDSGSAISYANGGYQVSYEQVPSIEHSRAGDPVKLCLVALPDDCPAGDDRGKVYKGTNLRTGESWSLPDAEHGCGGA